MSKISSKNIKSLSVPQSPVVLAILDGWGYRKEKSDNAIKSASTPIMDSLWHAYPHTLISASGSDVGLPDGQMGKFRGGAPYYWFGKNNTTRTRKDFKYCKK